MKFIYGSTFSSLTYHSSYFTISSEIQINMTVHMNQTDLEFSLHNYNNIINNLSTMNKSNISNIYQDQISILLKHLLTRSVLRVLPTCNSLKSFAIEVWILTAAESLGICSDRLYNISTTDNLTYL